MPNYSSHSVLVSGAGSIGRRHISNLKSLGVTRIAVCDPDSERLNAAMTSLEVQGFSDLESGLAEWKPNVVFVCSPPVYHVAQALEALRVGASAFVEKPLSDSLVGVDQLVREARGRNQVVQIGYNLRFHPGLRNLRDLMQNGTLGKILWLHAESGQYLPDWRPWQDYRLSYSGRKDLGGGILLDGSHELDYVCWLLGRPSEIICLAARLSNLKIDVEDCASLLLRFPSGVQAEVHLDFVQQGYTRTCKVVGEHGTALWDFAADHLKIRTTKSPDWQCLPYQSDANQMYVAEVQHFLDCVESGKTPSVSLQQAREVLELVLAGRSAAAARERWMALEAPTKGKVVAIIQARMGSSRLPGKSMASVAGHPMLWHVVHRVRRASSVDQVVVATTGHEKDDVIAQFCDQEDITCFRGSEQDVLDRYYRAAQEVGADVVVRVTADCPLIDPDIIDQVVGRFMESECDYASNTLVRTYPDGLDTEVFSFTAMERAWKEATKPSEREHVTPYLHTDGFRRLGIENPKERLERHRWTVDEPADLEFVRRVYAGLSRETTLHFGIKEILEFLRKDSGLEDINAEITSNEGYYLSLYREAVAGAAPKRTLQRSEQWFARAQKVIPGGSQTFSKNRTQYVQGVAPIFLEHGSGCRVWDVDGNEYIDYVQALLPNILGYANEDVIAAVNRQLYQGHSFSLPHPLEVELAERLVRLIPCAEMVRFAKNGSDATAGAVRAARAVTGRDHIACCGYHGWQDWFIGSTTRNAGIPGAVRELTHPFPYNDLGALEKVLDSHSKQFAAIIMEPVNFVAPAPGYLEGVKELARRHGALLIFDEICSGFHFGLGGAQKRYNVIPDMACFGKAMGNGFPIACVVGRSEVMKIFEEIFFSFTFGGEVASMAAALEVLNILEHTDALARMEANGRILKDGFNVLAKDAGVADRLACVGYPNWSLIKFRDAEGKDSLLLRSLVSQELAKRGILILVTHNLTAAHDDLAVRQTLQAYAATFKTVAEWLQEAHPERFLEGKMIEPVFRVR